jgi:hypothetical protein
MKHFYTTSLVIFALLTASATLQAQQSGFLPSYEGLEFASGEYGSKAKPIPNLTDKMASLDKIMVDQPEIFVASNSKYKGMKPEDSMALAEALRQAMLQNIDPKNLVDQQGPNAIYMRMAISDLHLKKKKRGVLSFTPVGAVAHATKSALTSGMMNKIDLVGVTVEVEALNAATGEHLGSFVSKLAPAGTGGSNEASWDKLLSDFDALSSQIACRIRNSKLPESDREDCKILDSYKEG